MGWRRPFGMAIAGLALALLALPVHAADWDDRTSTDDDVRMGGCPDIDAFTKTAYPCIDFTEIPYPCRDCSNDPECDYAVIINGCSAIIDADAGAETSEALIEAYVNRGIAYGNKGDNVRASKDSERAVALARKKNACALLVAVARSIKPAAEWKQFVDDCSNSPDCEGWPLIIRLSQLPYPEKIRLTCKSSN